MTPPFGPVLLHVGKLSVHWYGVLIVTGIMLGAATASYLAERHHVNPDKIWDMLLIAVIFGIIGARLYHVFSSPAVGVGWSYYKENPKAILYIWNGGLGIFGAIFGGVLGVLIYAWITHSRPLQLMDFSAPGLAIGQAIGRWGNYMNRELYGPPTTLPWGLDIPPQNRIPPYTDLSRYPLSTRFHPTFLYESIAALLLYFLLLWLAIRHDDKLKEGDLLIAYLMGYAMIRFGTEFLRPDAWMATQTLATAQVISLVLFAAGAIIMLIRHWPQRTTA